MSSFQVDPTHELTELFKELTELLKNPDVGAALAERGINASLALVAVEGVKAYLLGDKEQAADDLATVADEILGRLKLSKNSQIS